MFRVGQVAVTVLYSYIARYISSDGVTTDATARAGKEKKKKKKSYTCTHVRLHDGTWSWRIHQFALWCLFCSDLFPRETSLGRQNKM